MNHRSDPAFARQPLFEEPEKEWADEAAWRAFAAGEDVPAPQALPVSRAAPPRPQPRKGELSFSPPGAPPRAPAKQNTAAIEARWYQEDDPAPELEDEALDLAKLRSPWRRAMTALTLLSAAAYGAYSFGPRLLTLATR